MRVGVFGGTFDPVHQGHLILAEQCREQAELHEVWFVPAARPPHKLDQDLAPFSHRLAMLELAVAGNKRFRVDDLEGRRQGLSYTVDTLTELSASHPSADLHLLVGSDCLPDLPKWHRPERILELVALIVAERPNWPMWSNDDLQRALGVGGAKNIRMSSIQMPLFELSSRDIRQRVASKRSIRYLVPAAVEAYLESHDLYSAM